MIPKQMDRCPVTQGMVFSPTAEAKAVTEQAKTIKNLQEQLAELTALVQAMRGGKT